MPCFKRTVEPKLDTDQWKKSAQELAGTIAVGAQQAAAWAAPHVSKAADDVSRAAQDFAQRAQPTLDEARTRVVEDYLPRAQRAAVAAQAAATSDGTLSERAQRAAVAARDAALATPKKKHRVLKTFGWLSLAAGAAGAAYVLWRRSQPVEDPWAEEYWADVPTEDEAADVVDNLAEKAGDAAQDVKDAAQDAAKAVADKADEVADAAKDAVEEA